uniref:TSA: Wollemia nobilis Ref_Wollemi_Transcript_18713_1677 transcribed RNA sequence n=1 Tax=Wollemia nobilis TaxID=56998 RepID=A0A0C9RRQ7_9CONI
MEGFSRVLGLIILSVSVVVWRWVIIKNGRHGQDKLPPGSTGWPLIGETIAFMKAIRSPHQPRQFIQDHERRYGPIFRCNLFGNAQTIVSVDPEFNKYVLQNEGRLFEAKYPKSLRNLIGKYGLLSVHGELQRKLHAASVNLLKYEKLTSDFMDDIQSALLAGMKKWQATKIIRLQHECHKVVLNVMGKKLLDLPPYEEMEEVYKAFDEFIAALLKIPIKIPGSTYSRGIKAREILVNKIYECIKERRQHPEVTRNDLLTKLLTEESLSDEIIADLILFLLFAGYETSSTAMAFSIKFLTDNPRALEELRAEHDAILKIKSKDNGKLTWEDYESMKFTHCVIKETLRLGNVAPGVFREAKQDIKAKHYVIPKGWVVYVFLNGTNLDEKYYPEPFSFNPWRWKDEPSLKLAEVPWFMPFGRGARLCPGYHLARFEIALFLHHFVTKFRWEVQEADRVCYFPVPALVKGLPICIDSRTSE